MLVFINYWFVILIYAHSQNCEKQLLASLGLSICPSIRPRGTTWLPLDRFSWNLILEDFSSNCRKKIQVSCNQTRIKGTLHDDQHTFFIISRSYLHKMRRVSDKICSENQNTHFVFRNYFCKTVLFMRKLGKVPYSGAGHRWQYDNIRLHILTAFLL